MNNTFRLTASQEKQLFAEELAALRNIPLPAFNLHHISQIKGHVNLHHLAEVFDQLIRRHSMLRASITIVGSVTPSERETRVIEFGRTGKFISGTFEYSVVDQISRFQIEEHDLSAVVDSSQSKSLRKILGRAIRSKFDYASPPLIRGLLVRLTQDLHCLIFVVPHLVSDEESLNIMHLDILSLYQAFQLDLPPRLRQINREFSDFVAQQKDFLNSDAALPSIRYWKSQWEQFGEARVAVEDIARAEDLSDNYPKKVALTMNFDDSSIVKKFARDTRLTLNMSLLAAFYVAIAHRNRRPAIAIWMNFANRTEVYSEPLVGWFVNHHLIGLDIGSCKTGWDVIVGSRSALINAALHQKIPLNVLWNQVGSRTPRSKTRVYFNFRRHARVVEPGASRRPSVNLYSPSRRSNEGAGVSVVPRSLIVEATEKEGRLELSMDSRACRGGGCLAMQSILHHWAAVARLLPKCADQPLATLQGLAMLNASWHRIRDSIRGAYTD